MKALATRRELAETGPADEWKPERELSALPFLHQAAQQNQRCWLPTLLHSPREVLFSDDVVDSGHSDGGDKHKRSKREKEVHKIMLELTRVIRTATHGVTERGHNGDDISTSFPSQGWGDVLRP